MCRYGRVPHDAAVSSDECDVSRSLHGRLLDGPSAFERRRSQVLLILPGVAVTPPKRPFYRARDLSDTGASVNCISAEATVIVAAEVGIHSALIA